jgi:hypothetical protein
MRYLLATVCFLLLLFTLPHAVIAQDDGTSTGWPIVERCVTPTVRPDDWTFEGTILLEGYAGIHGVNDALSTPRVLVFLPEHGVPGGAGLSPDGKWYALLGGKTFYADSYYFFNVQEIQVFSTVNNEEIYRVPWRNSYAENWGMRRMYWLDNQHLIYESSENATYSPGGGILIINPFDGSTSKWTGKMSDVLYVNLLRSYVGCFYWSAYWTQTPSPDFTRILITASHALYDIWSGEVIVEINSATGPYVSWAPDSSVFAVEIHIEPGENQETRQLVLFDRDGHLFDVVLTDQRVVNVPSAWSHDGRYLTVIIAHQENLTLHIVDLHAHQIINTCLQTGEGAAFSPDNTQLAILEPGEGTKYLMVLDLESWALHPVANHIVDFRHGDVIGWRED